MSLKTQYENVDIDNENIVPLGSEQIKSVLKTQSEAVFQDKNCLLYTSPSPRDRQKSRMPSSA